jgi:hypothetical protein
MDVLAARAGPALAPLERGPHFEESLLVGYETLTLAADVIAMGAFAALAIRIKTDRFGGPSTTKRVDDLVRPPRTRK